MIGLGRRLGLTWDDEALLDAYVAEHGGDASLLRPSWLFMAAVLEHKHSVDKGIEGFEAAVISILARRGPLPLEELAKQALDALDLEQIMRYPEFRAEDRLRLLGPAIVDGDGLCHLPDHPMAGIDDKRLRRLNLMIGAIERRGPLHFSEITEAINAQLPVAYAMSERDVHSWLGRYTDVFTWAGRGRYGLIEQGVGIRLPDERSERHDVDGQGQITEVTGGHYIRVEGRGSEAENWPTRSRRRGIGNEIFNLLQERGPLPMEAIRAHIMQRFVVNVLSVDAAIAQDRAERFVWQSDGLVSLRSCNEQ